MTDLWFKRCPLCSNYMKKTDPQECSICCICGWTEYVGVTFFCKVANKYCTGFTQEDEQQLDGNSLQHTTHSLP